MRYGGNTSCVSIDLGDDDVLILDAGSGIRKLGEEVLSGGKNSIILLTHIHWDHIQGFPFYRPVYLAGQKITFIKEYPEWIDKLAATMDGSYFPMKFENLPSTIEFIADDIDAFFAPFGITVTHITTNHPGLCFGYKIQKGEQSVIYIPDNELDPPAPHTQPFEAFVDFCRNADILIHDAQYTDAEMPAKRGWGHSLLRNTCELALEANVRSLVLFHHDPERHDEALDEMQEEARQFFASHGADIKCHAAYEGLTLRPKK